MRIFTTIITTITKNSLLALALLHASVATASCVEQFTGFFERNIVLVPEAPYSERAKAVGKAVLADLASASPINPASPIAVRGYSGVGKCYVMPLENPLLAGHLFDADFNLTAMALRGDRSATWLLAPQTIHSLTARDCAETIDRTKSAARGTLPSLDSFYRDGSYFVNVPGRLEPVARQLLLSVDGRFVLSRSRLGRIAHEKGEMDLFQVCAYRVEP